MRCAVSLTPGGTISFAGTSVAPEWMNGKERLELVRAALEHVDEVDAARARALVTSLHVDERPDGMRLVGEQEEVVRRDEVEDERCQDDEPGCDAEETGR